MQHQWMVQVEVEWIFKKKHIKNDSTQKFLYNNPPPPLKILEQVSVAFF